VGIFKDINLNNSDEKIIAAEFTKLCECTYGKLSTRIYAKTGYNKYLADEILQTTYETAVLNREKLLAHPNPAGWLNKTAANIYYKLRNKNINTAKHETEYVEYNEYADTSFKYYFLDKQSEAGNTETVTAMIREIFILLTKKERELIKYRFYYDLSLREIAKKWNLNYDSVRKSHFRMLKKARKIFLSKFPDYRR